MAPDGPRAYDTEYTARVRRRVRRRLGIDVDPVAVGVEPGLELGFGYRRTAGASFRPSLSASVSPVASPSPAS